MSKNEKLNAWAQEVKELCKPDAVHWCDGSDAENANMIQRMLDAGTARKLNESKRPNSYLVWSDPAEHGEYRVLEQSQSDHDGCQFHASLPLNPAASWLVRWPGDGALLSTGRASPSV